MQTDRLYRSDDQTLSFSPPLSGEAERSTLRFVHAPLAPDAYRLLADLSGRIPNNKETTAHYIPAQRTAIEDFAHAHDHSDPAAFAAQTYTLLSQRALDLLGLARKAGALECGFTKVQAALNADKVHILLNASDSAEGGAKKLAHKARALEVPMFTLFCVAEMSAAVGRNNVHHMAMTKSFASANSKGKFFNAIYNALSLIDNFDHKDENYGG